MSEIASRPRGRGRRGRRGPLKATPAAIEAAALRYLERYASSSENLRRILMAKVERSARHHETDPEEGTAVIGALIARYLASGLLDDAGYAEAKARSLHRRGDSVRAIRAKLAAKGLARAEVEAALARLAAEAGPDSDGLDAHAARAYARRRRLGPWRAAAERAERRQRDLAALARAGFDYETARAVIDAESTEAE